MGLARAELLLGRFEPACSLAEDGLQLACDQHEPVNELDMLWVLGDIQATEDQVSGSSGADGKALSCYQQALARAKCLDAFVPPIRLLEISAKAYAANGNFERAFFGSQRAGEARQSSFNEQAARRSSALRGHHQIECARAESEHLRSLAESGAARFQLLNESHEVLQHLGQIGQEIPIELVAERICEGMGRHTDALLDAPCVAIYLLDEAGQQLYCAFGIEGGEHSTDPPIARCSARSLCVRATKAGGAGLNGGERGA